MTSPFAESPCYGCVFSVSPPRTGRQPLGVDHICLVTAERSGPSSAWLTVGTLYVSVDDLQACLLSTRLSKTSSLFAFAPDEALEAQRG